MADSRRLTDSGRRRSDSAESWGSHEFSGDERPVVPTPVLHRPVSDGVFALFFDGGRRSVSGETGCGAWARFPDGMTVFEGYWYLGNRTLSSNAAEYEGLVRGLRALMDQVVSFSRADLVIVGDSQLVIEQCSGNFAVRAPHLQPYVDTVRQLAREWKHRVVYRRTPRALNAHADSLANRAMDTRGSAVVLPASREDVVDVH